MIPSIILHLGPPKTATTSLQIALEQVDHPLFYYGGALQPKSRNEESLCQELYNFCSNQAEGDVYLQRLRGDLQTLLKEGKTVFLSEELFLLEQENAKIQEKIKRLNVALKDFNCKILLSARPGRAALPSLYQERFTRLPLRLQLDFDRFCHDSMANCYDYSAVCEMLKQFEFDNIHIIEYKKLTAVGFDLADIVDIPNFSLNSLILEKANIGQLGREKMNRTLPSVSLRRLGTLAPVKFLIDHLNIRSWPGFRKAVRLLDRIILRVPSELNLQVPEDVANRLDASYLDAVKHYGLHRQNRETSNKGLSL